jgi:hypothetical protein
MKEVLLFFGMCMVLRGFGRPRRIEYSAFSKSYTFLCIVQIHAVFETVLLYHILYLVLLIPQHTQNSLYYLRVCPYLLRARLIVGLLLPVYYLTKLKLVPFYVAQ